MYGVTDGEGEPLYGMAPMESEPAEIEPKPHESGNVATVLVDSGASGHYFDDLIIPELKNRLQDYTSLSTPRTIRTAGGALLDGTAESVLQGFITDDYGEQHLAPGGVTPQGSPSSSASVSASAPETAPAPTPAPVTPQATAMGINRYAMQPGATRVVTRSHVRLPVDTDYRTKSNKNAAVAGPNSDFWRQYG